MKLLVVSPDYASHAEPMAQIAREWQRRIGPAIVATGHSVRPTIQQLGLGWTHLRLGRGSNDGIIRADQQPVGEDDHLRAFFDATRAGAVATLRYQALARRHDLLFEPERVMVDLRRILDDLQPDRILVDHVAFGARLALHALGIEPASIVLGHPTALPAPGELYGLPPVWPAAIEPSRDDIADLERLCRASTIELAETSGAMLAASGRTGTVELTGTGGRPTIYMYPAGLHDERRSLPPDSVSIGTLRRTDDPVDPNLVPRGDGPRVLVAFGTFLSARSDVLATAVAAARLGGWRLALASGSTPPDQFGTLPHGALVRPHLPQVALLDHTDVLVTHGGNNSVTEACAAGVPMVVLPMSTDQFAGAAAVERAGIGLVLDPNTVDADTLRRAVSDVLAGPAATRVRAIATDIATLGGAAAAVDAIFDLGRQNGQTLVGAAGG